MTGNHPNCLDCLDCMYTCILSVNPSPHTTTLTKKTDPCQSPLMSSINIKTDEFKEVHHLYTMGNGPTMSP